MSELDGDEQRRRDLGLISRVEAEATVERARPMMEQGRFDEALTVFGEAVAANDRDIEAMRHLGILLSRLGRLDEGEDMLRRAMTGSGGMPYYAVALGLNLMMQGRYGDGWPLFQMREHSKQLNIGIPTNMPFARWNGRDDIAGQRLLLVPEQGFGDQIQFARFIPALVDRGVVVTLLAPPALERLFRHNLPGIDIQVASGAVKLPQVDYWAPVMDVFGAWAARGDPLPQPPYLRPLGPWANAPQGFKIGLATAGNTALINDRRRSLSEEQAASLRAMLPGKIIPLDPARTGARDFADSASMVQALDLIITVDTAAAHLAGAMGRPCFVMLPGYGTDWRWMRGRSDSPWYPSLTLYRDSIAGGWSEVFAAVAADAHALAAATGAPA